MKYIDIHGHANFTEYDIDREAVMVRATDAEVGVISVGTGLEASRVAIAMAEKYPNTWAIIGIHPNHAHEEVSATEFAELKKLAVHPKVVAIGECGLDYVHSEPEFIARQLELFILHIQLANELNKPLMLHIRNAKDGSTNAYEEALVILKDHARVKANFHFFAGTLKNAQDIIAAGHYISFTTVLTFARNYDEVVRIIPLDHIMSETDCPYVAPIPHRGSRNEPSYVIEGVKKIAEIRGEPLEAVAAQLVQNAKEFFMI